MDEESALAVVEQYLYSADRDVDREHDKADRAAGHHVACPVLALWSAAGPFGTWYTDEGGPLELWRELALAVTGQPVDGGHFPEEHPQDTAHALAEFFAADGT